MGKISLIIKREYLTRVKKRSFIIMTILGPILMAAIMIVPIWVATLNEGMKTIVVKDETTFLIGHLNSSEDIRFVYSDLPLDSLKAEFKEKEYYAILHIPRPSDKLVVYGKLISNKSISLTVQGYIKEQIKKETEKIQLMGMGIDNELIERNVVNVNLETAELDDDTLAEKKTNPVISLALGLFGGIMIYFFIFMFGAQVMRGVIEEKTSRIVEVIVSSVKPFQLMLGKIIGIAMVGLTQFLLWVVLTGGLYGIFMLSFGDKLEQYNKERINITQNQEHVPVNINNSAQMLQQNEKLFKVFDEITSINFPSIIGSFLFFFLFGYLLYAALFAAIGSAVDNETDTQQFMLPITIPLILPVIMSSYIANNPDGNVAIWLSTIPFTAPIAMMIRVPFGVDWIQLAISMVLLILTFIGATWFAGKIYRTGILMYGKKPSYKELWKWIRYKA